MGSSLALAAGSLPAREAGSEEGSSKTAERHDRFHLVGLFAVALGFLLPVVYLEPTYHTFLAAKIALALVALVPGFLALARIARAPNGESGEIRRAARLALAFCGVAALSTALADVPLLSFTGPAGDGTGLVFVLVCAGCWAMGTELRERHRHLLGTAIISAAAVNAAVACLQSRGWVPPVLEMDTAGPLAGRAFGLTGNPVHLGALCAGGLLLAGARVRGTRRVAGWLVLAVLLAGAAQLSGARAALVLTLLGLGVVLVRWWPGWRRAVLVVVAVLAGLQFATAGVQVVDARSRLQGNASFDGSESRVSLWHEAVDAVVERPLVGWGPGRFAAATTPRYSPELTREGVFNNSHNWVLEYASTSGLIGLALLVGWLAVATRRARGPLAWFALSYALVALVQPMSVALTPVALLALGAATPTMSAVSKVRGGGDRRSARVVSAVFVSACVAFALTYLVGEVRMRDALLDSSPAAWQRADALLPASPEVTYLGARIEAYQALTSRDAAHRERALRLARETTARDPANPRWWSYLGALEMKWGSAEAAAAAYDQALDRLPWFSPALRGTAELAEKAGDTARRDDACRRLAQVVRRLPGICPESGTG